MLKNLAVVLKYQRGCSVMNPCCCPWCWNCTSHCKLHFSLSVLPLSHPASSLRFPLLLSPISSLSLPPLSLTPLPLILSPILSLIVVHTKEQTWLVFMAWKLWFLYDRISYVCLNVCSLSSGDCWLSVVFQCPCSAINTHRVSVLNDVSNAEKCD